jgi:cell wall-associated NlpC family hydrolase
MFVATNLTDLHREPSFLSEMFVQVLNGERLEVLEEQEKWCRVQWSGGYEGWAHKQYLTAETAPAPTHIISALFTKIHAEPDIVAPKISCLMGGTMIAVQESMSGLSHVRPCGSMLPEGWVQNGSLRARSAFPLPPAIARRQILDDARRFMGVYYLWGGNTAFGIDCSGLAWLTHRLAGYTLPRDAHPQCQAGRAIEPPYQPGDLLFFRSDNNPDRIGHVGISLGGMRMIHSSRTNNGVYEEDVQTSEKLSRTFAGARTYL